jgi:hypothetical protein
MTLVSTFSLQQAWRGRPQLLQFFTMPSEKEGMRLVVNERPYTGPKFVGSICTSIQQSPEAPGPFGQFMQPSAGAGTFVLADRLRSVVFQYLRRPETEKGETAGVWLPAWQRPDWPAGIRIVIEPIEPTAARLQPVSVTAPIYIYRNPQVVYVDR